MTIDPNAIATELARSLTSAWNAADGDAFGAVFTTDADFVDIRGDHHRSRAAIAKGHEMLFDSLYRGSTVEYHVTAARVLGDIVLAHLRCAMTMASSPLPANDGATISIVVVREGGAWRIAAFHNTLRILHDKR